MSLAGSQPFRYIDLFAGIGGFAAALQAFGGECVYSIEKDPAAAGVYERNWGHSPLGDLTDHANDTVMVVPEHDVLVAGFPCQPFSKSGAQRGMEETRGTLYWNILKVIQAHHPTIVVLENVKNLAGRRHEHEWKVIIDTLREAGYRVSDKAVVLSPHRLPLELGGRPQVRERVFITATYDPEGLLSHEDVETPLAYMKLRGRGDDWSVAADLPLVEGEVPGTSLTRDEMQWIDAWDDFVTMMWPVVRSQALPSGRLPALPGFPLWYDRWIDIEALTSWAAGAARMPYRRQLELPDQWEDVPAWKQTFLVKNAQFYSQHKDKLDAWAHEHGVASFPASRRKLEWQAQQTESLWECVLQLRPSGIRAKRATHLPALVAITQTSILGQQRRRLSTGEAALLQGLPETFDFGPQSPAETYKQLGNGVNVGVVWNVLRAHAQRDREILMSTDEGRALYRNLVEEADGGPDERVKEALAAGQARYCRSQMAVAV
ncbi:DNA (cytosine-5-)-methyltransferase [Arthrobacter sp. NEB 688]|nr:DNA (cytosine-5-)-methyltransferase [Arthrobacter sp. NEB 688]